MDVVPVKLDTRAVIAILTLNRGEEGDRIFLF